VFNLSPENVSGQQENQPSLFELWLYDHAARVRMPVRECGLFDELEEACTMARALREWVAKRDWPVMEFGDLPPDEQEELEDLPDVLTRCLGVDPMRVLITVREYRSTADANDNYTVGNREHYRLRAMADEEDDGSEDDTVLAPEEEVRTVYVLTLGQLIDGGKI
jgi:hypothetical protein